MRELESYSIDELEELTGVNRRTISYYIAEGLLPKVGRRGSRTRYGREFLDRLRFIQKVKDLQDAGKLPSVTLSDIARILDRLGNDDVAEALRSQQQLLGIFADSYGAESFRAGVAEAPAEAPEYFGVPESADPFGEELTWGSTETRMLGAKRRRRNFLSRLKPEARVEKQPAAVSDNVSGYAADDKTLDMFTTSFSAMREDARRDMQELAEMRGHMADIRDATRSEMRELQQMTRDVAELRERVREEIRDLHRSLEDLARLRRQEAAEREGGEAAKAADQQAAAGDNPDTASDNPSDNAPDNTRDPG